MGYKMSRVGNIAINFVIATLIAKILGFVREISLTTVYGAGAVTDAYIISSNIPLILFSVIGSALCTIFIPLYCNIEQKSGKDKALKFSNNICNILIILSILLSIVGVVFSNQLIKLFAMDFSGEKLKLSNDFIKVMVPGVIFISISNIMICWLQIKEKFIIPALITIPYNIIIIISIFISSKTSTQILGIGFLVATISQVIFILPFSYKNQYKYIPYIDLKDENIKKMIKMIIPVFIGVCAYQINIIVDKSLASTMGNGIITVLNSANRLNDFIKGIFIVSVTSIVYPILSKLFSEGDMDKFKITITRSINIVVVVIVPITVGVIVLSDPIVRIVFERGNFDQQATSLTSLALIFYSLGLLADGLMMIFDKIFYALGDTKTPMKSGVLSVAVNIILNLILIKVMGYSGLALATSIAALVGTLFLFNRLNKTMDLSINREILQNLYKCICASAIMGVAVYSTYSILGKSLGIEDFQGLVSLVISVAVGVIVYGTATIIFKVEEVDFILSAVKLKQ